MLLSGSLWLEYHMFYHFQYVQRCQCEDSIFDEEGSVSFQVVSLFYDDDDIYL